MGLFFAQYFLPLVWVVCTLHLPEFQNSMLEKNKIKMAMPLKRHAALIPLSQDHHFGLLLVWKIKQGLKFGIVSQRMVDYLLYFQKEHLEPHFAIEEGLIFSYLGKNDSMRMQAEKEHELLRHQIAEISKGEENVTGLLKKFVETLEGHIRFEERKLFQHMQAELMEKDLQEMEQEVMKVHAKEADKWEDHFWVN